MRARSAYDRLGADYYGPHHKTSRNFDEATRRAVLLAGLDIPPGLLLEPGCGRGRSQEFLGVEAERVVQLDSSLSMLDLSPREEALLRILHEAEELPFAAGQFSCVAAFLCDAFLGLNFLVEAKRVLVKRKGLLVGTTPSFEWGEALRRLRKIPLWEARFLTSRGEQIVAPSNLYTLAELEEMLSVAGFDPERTQVTPHTLPEIDSAVSPDIKDVAAQQGISVYEIPILYWFSAET